MKDRTYINLKFYDIQVGGETTATDGDGQAGESQCRRIGHLGRDEQKVYLGDVAAASKHFPYL